MDRREFLKTLSAASVAGFIPAVSIAGADAYDIPSFGQVRLLHITDTHAQLNPVYYREPHVNVGVAGAWGKPPHIVGDAFLEFYGIADASPEAYAFTYKNFAELAEKYGKVGGYAHMKSLIDQLRQSYGPERTLLLDGGDSWQGSGTALWTRGMEMVQANNLLGVDVATGHWEFTYEPSELRANLEAFQGEFIAHNVYLTEDALFDEKPAFDEFTGHAFPPFTIKTMGGFDIAVIGQAFPYTPIANPRRNIPDWTFGIRLDELQELVDQIRDSHSPDAVILLSHNGMDVDQKLASLVSGVDAILGGHTHDAVPSPVQVKNPGGTTLVTNAGSNGKFVGVLDLKLGSSGIEEFRYRLLPVFGNYLDADPDMQRFIRKSRMQYANVLDEELAVTESLLFRRGNFNGTFDEIIGDALRNVLQSEIALSPGFRWGTSVVPGQAITMEDVLAQTAITYPETYVREINGEALKLILEDVADNAFNPDPFYQQGGDMVRVSGMTYSIDPTQAMGNRISDLRLVNGNPILANKNYLVSGWATVGEVSSGPPVWEVVAEFLRSKESIQVDQTNQPKIKLKAGNPGIGDWRV